MLYRKARFDDTEPIYNLIDYYAKNGLMLPRSRNALYETLRDMIVAESEDGKVVGVGGLHITWDSLAEVRSLAVHPDFGRRGIGSGIVSELVKEGRQLGVKTVFTLTYQSEFFASCGFDIVSKDDLPHKVWKECIDCPKFPNCNEIAMILRNNPDEV